MNYMTESRIKRENNRSKVRSLVAEGYSYKEINTLTGFSLGTISNYINKDEKPLEPKKKKKKKTYTKEDSVKAKNNMLLFRYGITLDEYNQMYLNQNKKCAICNTEKKLGGRSGLYVDHCHKTGKVRGLLCPSCNTAIGKLKEDKNIFMSALRYLEHR